MTKCDMSPGWDPTTERGHQVKTKEIRVKYELQLMT